MRTKEPHGVRGRVVRRQRRGWYFDGRVEKGESTEGTLWCGIGDLGSTGTMREELWFGMVLEPCVSGFQTFFDSRSLTKIDGRGE